MNKLDAAAHSRILHILCEGNSIRAIERMTGASKHTITKLLVDAGKACMARNRLATSVLPLVITSWKACAASGP